MAHATIDIELGGLPGRRKHLVVTPEEVSYGDHSVVLDRVDQVACLGTRRSAFMGTVRAGSGFQCWLADDRDEVSILASASRLPSQERRLATIQGCLEEVLFGTLIPRLAAERVAQFRQGETVTVGGHYAIVPGAGNGTLAK